MRLRQRGCSDAAKRCQCCQLLTSGITHRRDNRMCCLALEFPITHTFFNVLFLEVPLKCLRIVVFPGKCIPVRSRGGLCGTYISNRISRRSHLASQGDEPNSKESGSYKIMVSEQCRHACVRSPFPPSSFLRQVAHTAARWATRHYPSLLPILNSNQTMLHES